MIWRGAANEPQMSAEWVAAADDAHMSRELAANEPRMNRRWAADDLQLSREWATNYRQMRPGWMLRESHMRSWSTPRPVSTKDQPIVAPRASEHWSVQQIGMPWSCRWASIAGCWIRTALAEEHQRSISGTSAPTPTAPMTYRRLAPTLAAVLPSKWTVDPNPTQADFVHTVRMTSKNNQQRPRKAPTSIAGVGDWGPWEDQER